MENLNQSEKKDFLVSSASLKDVRAFSRDVFEKFKIDEDLREELVLAIAEAAQNIVKHAYKDFPNTQDRMVVRISCKDEVLEISFFDKGKPVEESKVKHRAIDDIKPGGLGTFFIQEIMDSIKFEPGKKPWINNLVLTKGQELIVVILPYEYQTRKNNCKGENLMPQNQLAKILKDKNIKFYDLVPLFCSQDKKKDLFYKFDPMHLSERGHNLIFKFLSNEVFN